MIRALIAAALLAAAAADLFRVPADAALGYALSLAFLGWLLWPLLRRSTRRRPRSQSRTTARLKNPPARHQDHDPATTPHFTQINHHYHYYNGDSWPSAAPQRPNYGLPALPRHTQGRIASDAVLHPIIDIDIDGTP